MTGRVLIVDDIPANLKLLEARLSAEYFDVVTASSGAAALDICERAQCDIVLLDVMMPDIDGFEVYRRLKANPSTHACAAGLQAGLHDRARSAARGGHNIDRHCGVRPGRHPCGGDQARRPGALPGQTRGA